MANNSIGTAVDIADYWQIAVRRKWSFLVPFLVIVLISIALAIFLPPTFRSEATILVERQEIPTDLVGTTVTGFVQERIEAITKRVNTRENLLRVAQKAGLAAEDLDLTETEQLIDDMSESIFVEMVDIQASDPNRSRAAMLTIAFTVAAETPTASSAQNVAKQLTELYLGENKRLRVEQATEVNRFLEEQAGLLSDQINQYESKLAKFKSEQIGQLPGQMETNATLLERTETRLELAEESIRSLQNQRRGLEAQLATVDRYVARNSNAEQAVSALERLAITRQELQQKKQKYSDLHPEVIRLNAEVKTLKLEVKSEGGSTSGATNPEYIAIRSQIQAIDTDLAAEKTKRNDLERKSEQISARIMNSPLVEKEYTSLIREYDTAKKSFDEIKRKQLGAKLASNLEEDEKGQKFTLLESANLPSLPVRPNRIGVFLIGTLLAGIVGVGFALFAEVTDKTIRGVSSVMKIFKAPPIAVIPILDTAAE